jgi:spermidine/putrescine transport system ATP-binding protein
MGLISGGQKQRVALACAMFASRSDPMTCRTRWNFRRQMQVFLKQIQRHSKTRFVFVTHDQDEAITMSTAQVMSQGRIEQLGTPMDLYYRPTLRASFRR